MLAEWLTSLVQSKIGELVSGRLARVRKRLRARRALAGGDTLVRHSAKGVVADCIEGLLREPALPSGVLSASARGWLQSADAQYYISEYIIARQADDEPLANGALKNLASSYELFTGEIRALAEGHVRAIADYVVLRIQGDDELRVAFQTALAAESAAAQRRHRATQTCSSATNIRDIIRSAAASLLRSAAQAWQLPERCIPLRAEIFDKANESRGTIAELTGIIDFIRAGRCIVLSGEAGIGKTTGLLQVCEQLLAEHECPIPVFFDAATWASRKLPIIDFLAELPTFRSEGVGTAELSKLTSSGALLLAINGWNEIESEAQRAALQLLQQFVRGAPGAILAVATRSSDDTFGLPTPVQLQVRGLDWERQKEMVFGALPGDDSAQLISRLGTDHNLRYLARNPLVLRALVSLQENRHEVPKTMYDILEGVQQMYESHDLRASALEAAPLLGLHRQYMKALAVRMNHYGQVILREQDALATLNEAAGELHGQGQLTNKHEARQILSELCHQHLLHWDKATRSIRFIHQRFQELYSATVVLEMLQKVTEGDRAASCFVTEVINQPFWGDAILLASEKLSSSGPNDGRGPSLTEAAIRVDLEFACEIAGRCGLRLHSGSKIQALCDAVTTLFNKGDGSHLCEYAAYAMIQTKLPYFSSVLWSLLESDDDQCRWTIYRLGDGISLEQLGGGAAHRISKWSTSRRAEFVREAADSPENLPFVENVARHDPDDGVRAAAIASLAWSYPASDLAISAWLAAPDNVKVTHEVLPVLFYLPEATGRADVRAEVERLAKSSDDGSVLLELAQYFPDVAGNYAVSAALDALVHAAERGVATTTPLDVLTRHAPSVLNEYVEILVLNVRYLPPWVREQVEKWEMSERAELFETAWAHFQSSPTISCDIEFIGSLADDSGVAAVIDAYVTTDVSDTAGNASDHRYDQLAARLPIVALVTDLLARASKSTPQQIKRVLGTVLHQLSEARDAEKALRELRSAASLVDSLVQALWSLEDEELVQQHEIKAYLCSILSKVDAVRYMRKIMEGLRLHLAAWQGYRRLISVWVPRNGVTRPSNPYTKTYFINAGFRCGFQALQELLQLATEPEANQVIHPLIVDILAGPNLKSTHASMGFLGRPDMTSRKSRIATGTVLQQTDHTLQQATDDAAVALTNIFERYLEVAMSGDVAQLRLVASLAGQLARIPSQVPLPVIERALVSENFPHDAFTGSLCALASQGYSIREAAIIERLQQRWATVMEKPWMHTSDFWQVHELASLHYFIQDATYGQEQLDSLARQWSARTNVHDVVRELIRISSESSWRCVFTIIEGRPSAENWGGELLYSLSNVEPGLKNGLLLEISESGLLFSLIRSEFEARNLAKEMAVELESDGELLRAFLAACGKSESVAGAWLACAIVSALETPPASAIDFVCQYFDSTRYPEPGAWERACFELVQAFSREETVNGSAGTFNRIPQACNALRERLFDLATKNNTSSVRARKLLLAVELDRLSLGRPGDEPRHPRIRSDIAWPVGLYK